MAVIVAGVTNGIPYETLTINLAANEVRAISKTAAYLSVLSATSPTGLQISFNGASFFQLPPGISISEFVVDELWVKDTSGGANTVVLATGVAVFRDNRLVIDALSPLPVTFPANSPVNVSQFGGNAVVTGVGASGVGIPRVTLSNDSVLAANQSVNNSQWGGTNVVNGGTAGLVGVGGPAAHSAAASGNPVRVGGKVSTAVDTTLVSGDLTDALMTNGGALTVFPYAVPDVGWQYAAAAAGILNTTVAVTIKAAAAAGIRNYISGIDIEWEALTNATEFCIRDGAAGTVIYRTKLPAGATGRKYVQFASPLRGTAATLLEVVTLTASGAGAVYVNAQGFTAP